jgi:hypothetical protein
MTPIVQSRSIAMLRSLGLVVAVVGAAIGSLRAETDARLLPYVAVLQRHARDPLRFVVEKLDTFDLLVFDDALHTAVEPFDFYRRLVEDAAFQRKASVVFLEVIPSNKQRHLDDYLAAPSDDPRLLYPAFQDDANGFGFPYKTYFDFLSAVRAVNQTLPQDKRLNTVAVGSPTFWSEIQTPRDLEQFRKSLASYDHHMYASIRDEMEQFEKGRKGIFLTNTRHAYTGIKRSDGQYFWNTTTFFTQRHPGKVCSIRLHNVSLFIQAVRTPSADDATSAQGLENIEYTFVRIGRGIWDSAFRANGDTPVAFPLAGNVFGKEPYIGNHQLDALPGQTMQDAYDAVIFLSPLETLRQTGFVDVIYTPEFRQELKRRYRLSYTEAQLAAMLKDEGVAGLDEYIAKAHVARPEQPLPQAQAAGPIDAWKTP